MEKELCPPLLNVDLDLGYTINSSNRSINSVVNVLCNNRTVSVLKCLSSRVWNGTKAPCTPDVEVAEAEEVQVETIIIIVWVLGGVLLLALLVLLAVIVTSHKKDVRGSSPRTSIFTVSSNRNSRGGDNPAFTTENESPQGQTSLARNSSHRSSLRPPSYHEAVSGRIICVPGMAARMSPNVGRATPSGGRREINSPRTRQNREENCRSNNGARGRYVYDYPSCYWEEEPPPPYSLVVGDRPEPSSRIPASSSHQPRSSATAGVDSSRIQHIERHRPLQTSAPIARLEYDCF
ncbi:uncharacterized protein [Haliotis asinina]|uniref:uncharacterized protein isoform X1 n=1 Tax=Haliotis asinina TaxID=109174 RepID=UPI003531F77C